VTANRFKMQRSPRSSLKPATCLDVLIDVELGISASRQKLVRGVADGQNANSAARRQGITGEVHSWFERNNSRPSYLFLVFLSLLLSFARIVFL
jgi:hypothetical protein